MSSCIGNTRRPKGLFTWLMLVSILVAHEWFMGPANSLTPVFNRKTVQRKMLFDQIDQIIPFSLDNPHGFVVEVPRDFVTLCLTKRWYIKIHKRMIMINQQREDKGLATIRNGQEWSVDHGDKINIQSILVAYSLTCQLPEDRFPVVVPICQANWEDWRWKTYPAGWFMELGFTIPVRPRAVGYSYSSVSIAPKILQCIVRP